MEMKTENENENWKWETGNSIYHIWRTYGEPWMQHVMAMAMATALFPRRDVCNVRVHQDR